MSKDPRHLIRRGPGRSPGRASGNASPAVRGEPGNAASARPLATGDATRDEMLEHLGTRLEAVEAWQQEELAQLGYRNQREWWDEVADTHKPEATLPDPTRWHDVATAYDAVLQALARGDLARAGQLLRHAHDLEQAAYDAMPAFARHEDSPRPGPNPWQAGVVAHPCGRQRLPAPLRDRIHRIHHVRSRMDMPPVRPLADREPEVGPGIEDEDEEAGDG